MTKRREDLAISKHTINLYDGDYDKIKRWYPARIGAAKVIRDIVHAHVRTVEENAAQKSSYEDLLDYDEDGELVNE